MLSLGCSEGGGEGGSGGSAGTGGTGGVTGNGGAAGSGGASGQGGAAGSGGVAGSGRGGGSGGAAGSGGASGQGGTAGSGGGSGGVAGSGGSGGVPTCANGNCCPIIESFVADPTQIPSGETMTTVRVDATDPDDFPVTLRTELSAETGVFADRFAAETTFTCGAAGPVEMCVKANDGDPKCDERSCITVQCPTEIPANSCPSLFVINAIPRMIAEGENSTLVQTRAQDTDGLPLPLTLALTALWGSFENTENIQQPGNRVEQNATYICDRPGLVEICVDATDGACTKTLCDTVVCPDTL